MRPSISNLTVFLRKIPDNPKFWCRAGVTARSRYTQPQAHSTTMGFELFNARKLHDRWSDILKSFLGEV